MFWLREGIGTVKAISFLGTGSYEEVTYTWEGKEFVTHLFPEALARLFQVDKLFVLVTPQVRSHPNFSVLCSRLGKLVLPVEIPEGKSEEELWQIFDRCTEIVGEEDKVILDITHAFRSLPLIVFTVAAYLRKTKRITVQHVVYGAFSDKEKVATVLDLTPLLDLLDWLTGAEFLLRRGDATFLAERIEIANRRIRQRDGNGELPKKLQSLSEKLRRFSLSLFFAHPRSVMRYASELEKTLDVVAPEVLCWAKPFGVVLTNVRQTVERFAYDAPERLDTENLRKQLDLITYFLEKGLVPQAALLAREWIINYTILERGSGDWLDRGVRLEVENALCTAARVWCRKETEDLPEWFVNIPKNQEIAKLWDWLANLRNKIAHCGLNKEMQEARRLEEQAKKLPEKLQALLSGASLHSLQGNRTVIDLQSLYEGTAKIEDLSFYIKRVQELAGEGKEVVLTGQAPVWLYLSVAHALHGKARRLLYASPVTGETVIFDHSPE